MTLAEIGRWLQDCVACIGLAWSRSLELFIDGRFGQLRIGDLVIIGLTCLALGWLIDATVRDRGAVTKEPRRNR